MLIDLLIIKSLNQHKSIERSRFLSVPDHYVVINLRQGGKVISTKETKGASGPNAVWNAPFLFDLPPGDVIRLPLVLEFIVMQVNGRYQICMIPLK